MSLTENAKGPLVWLDMDQSALDAAYDQAVWAPNQGLIAERRNAAAADSYARLKHQRVSYGATPIEAFDFYSCGAAKAPIVIFIHGGAWRAGDASVFAHLAEPIMAMGAHAAILDFTNIDPVDGHLEIMAAQVRAGAAHVIRNCIELGGDPARIFVMGHSSGAHLSSCVLTTDWASHGLPASPLAGVLVMSGMYELEPVRRSKRSLYVKFTDELVHDLSAIRHLDRIHCPVVVCHGTQESPEFIRQAQEFVAALKNAGKQVELIVVQSANHFEMLEAFHNPFGFVGRAASQLVKNA
jgi:arylformamidase